MPERGEGRQEREVQRGLARGRRIEVLREGLPVPGDARLEDLEDGSRRWVFEGTVQTRLAAGEKNRSAIVAALSDVGLDKQAIAERTDLSVRVVERYLPALERDGVIDSVKEPGRRGRKLYILAPTTQPATLSSGEPPW